MRVLGELLAEGRTDEVMALVAKLVSRNSELELLLSSSKSSGKKNEGVSTAQLVLLLGGLAAESNATLAEVDAKLRASSGIDEKQRQDELAAAAPKKKRQAPARRPIPPGLRRVMNLIPVPAAERPCPRCGGERECIGHDISSVIDLVPAEVILRLNMREKLACRPCEGELVRAPLGDKVVPGGKMGTTLVAQVLVDKYYDGLPLSRQVERFKRLGLEVAISTLADQVRWATEALQPLWRAAMAKVLRAAIMHLDGTSLPVLDKETAKGIRLGSLWGYVGTDFCGTEKVHTALYLYNSTGKKNGQREGELGPEDVLNLRTGYAVADASGLFDASFKRKELIECGCNMHSRRRLIAALDAGDTRAALPLAAYKKLYDIEEEFKDSSVSERQLARQARSKPLFKDLQSWVLAHRPYEPPATGMGKAIGYLYNHRLALARFLDDGIIPIDNGIVERLHVRAALTRKNFLFAGSDAGAERAAVAFTLLGCCKLAEVNPVEYLADVLPRLATRRIRLCDMPALLPAAWKAARTGSTGVQRLATAVA